MIKYASTLSMIIRARIAFIQFSMAAIDSSSVAVHPGLKDRYSCVIYVRIYAGKVLFNDHKKLARV